MQVKVEKVGKNVVQLEIEVDAEKFEQGMQKSFQRMQASLIYLVLEKEKHQGTW